MNHPMDLPIRGEIIGADFDPGLAGKILVLVAVDEDVAVGHQHVVLVEADDYERRSDPDEDEFCGGSSRPAYDRSADGSN